MSEWSRAFGFFIPIVIASCQSASDEWCTDGQCDGSRSSTESQAEAPLLQFENSQNVITSVESNIIKSLKAMMTGKKSTRSPTSQETDSCPWLSQNSGTKDVVVCDDGTRVTDWKCRFAGHGQRKLCPPNAPYMCNEETCGDGGDFCCSPYKFCAKYDGIRHCPAEHKVCPTTDTKNSILCEDGAKVTDWVCVGGRHGQRAKCPPNAPNLCVNKLCGGRKDHCCHTTCEGYGGIACATVTLPTATPIVGKRSLELGEQDRKWHVLAQKSVKFRHGGKYLITSSISGHHVRFSSTKRLRLQIGDEYYPDKDGEAFFMYSEHHNLKEHSFVALVTLPSSPTAATVKLQFKQDGGDYVLAHLYGKPRVLIQEVPEVSTQVFRTAEGFNPPAAGNTWADSPATGSTILSGKTAYILSVGGHLTDVSGWMYFRLKGTASDGMVKYLPSVDGWKGYMFNDCSNKEERTFIGMADFGTSEQVWAIQMQVKGSHYKWDRTYGRSTLDTIPVQNNVFAWRQIAGSFTWKSSTQPGQLAPLVGKWTFTQKDTSNVCWWLSISGHMIQTGFVNFHVRFYNTQDIRGHRNTEEISHRMNYPSNMFEEYSMFGALILPDGDYEAQVFVESRQQNYKWDASYGEVNLVVRS